MKKPDYYDDLIARLRAEIEDRRLGLSLYGEDLQALNRLARQILRARWEALTVLNPDFKFLVW
jgi:hypothetical protein